ncbi:GIN domain-containing protein [Niveispirillum sp. KHB5.9]|uniref:GIN domain-containing protein n=1 Tax=Niveispirillum sp. KHB5.9 TaxID=3400269 RepID=UPI003A8A9D94
MSLKPLLLATALTLTSLPALAFGPQDFSAKEVTIQGVVGRLEVKVDDGASKVTASVTGPARWVDLVEVRQEGGDLVIRQKESPRERRWREQEDWVTVQVTVPAGTKLEIDDFAGEGTVGDLRGAFSIDGMNSGKLAVGRVTTASVGIDGSGDVKLGDVDRDVSLEINGSGSVITGRTAGKAELEINGSGEITLAHANGPISAEINGSGDIRIQSGLADPLAVEINGSGSLLLDGVARNQSIEQSGSGNVKVTGKTS